MKIVIPIAGKSSFFDDKDFPFSKSLIEIEGKSMIQHVIENISTISSEFQFVFVVNQEDCKKFHLHNILKILSKNASIIKLNGETKGALCSTLMAIEHISLKEELIICNGDQIIDCNFDEVLNFFREKKADVGLITFNSVHPRWSYIRFDDNNENVIETAEKRPISRNAIAGFYYFKDGKLFIDGATKSIEKGDHVNDLYYIAPSINQLILNNKKISVFKINDNNYHSFYSPQKIREYENQVDKD